MKFMKYDRIKERAASLFYHYKGWLTERIFSLKGEGKRSPPADSSETGHETSDSCNHIMPEKTADDISDSLYDLMTSLDIVCKKAEPNFIHLGKKLESVYLDATDLTEQTLGTVRQISLKSDESILAKVEQITGESIAELSHCQTKVTTDISLVNAIIGHLSDLSCMCDGIEKIALSLRVVGFNISLESSRSKKSSDMFTVVFQDIYRLSEKIVRISDDIRENIGATRVSQLSVHSKISDALNQLRRLSDDAQQAVQDSAQEVRQLMELSLSTLETASANSREVSFHVEEIVAGIQIHDSVTQRVAHINNALNDVIHLCTEETSETTDTEKAGVACAIAEIQCAQLSQTIAEIDDVDEKSRTAFEQIHSEVGRLTDSISIFGVSETESASVPLFSKLQSDLSNLRQIIGQGIRLTDQIQETATGASDTAGRLEDHIKRVQEISFETHLVSLNAIVKAAHLGDVGKALEILAQEVKYLSDQSDKFVKDVAKTLETISVSVQEIRKIPLDLSSENQIEREQSYLEKEGKTGQATPSSEDSPESAYPTETDSDLSIQIEQGEVTDPLNLDDSPFEEVSERDVGIYEMARAYEQFRSDSSDAFKRAEALKRTILQTVSELGFFSVLSEDLSGYLCQLKDIVRILASRADKDINCSSETKRLLERYTMQQERDIHDQLILQKEALFSHSEDDIGEKEDGDDEDDFDDNVELF